jgi:hypothetical protein
MPSSGLLRRVIVVRTDVSVERIASIIKVKNRDMVSGEHLSFCLVLTTLIP